MFRPDSEGLCPSKFGCQGPQREQCSEIVQHYHEQVNGDMEVIEEEPESHDPQILRHIVLLILLLCSMFVVSTKPFSYSTKMSHIPIKSNVTVTYHHVTVTVM